MHEGCPSFNGRYTSITREQSFREPSVTHGDSREYTIDSRRYSISLCSGEPFHWIFVEFPIAGRDWKTHVESTSMRAMIDSSQIKDWKEYNREFWIASWAIPYVLFHRFLPNSHISAGFPWIIPQIWELVWKLYAFCRATSLTARLQHRDHFSFHIPHAIHGEADPWYQSHVGNDFYHSTKPQLRYQRLMHGKLDDGWNYFRKSQQE